MASNEIFYGNPSFIKACMKIMKERTDEKLIINAALKALESLRTRINEADWRTQEALKEKSNNVFNLCIGYESFLVSIKRERGNDRNAPFKITALTLGPTEN